MDAALAAVQSDLGEACAAAIRRLQAAADEELARKRSELECRGRALDQREQKLNQLQAELEKWEQQLVRSGVTIKTGTADMASSMALRARVHGAPSPSRAATARNAEAEQWA